MPIERTLAIIKPDAVKRLLQFAIFDRAEKVGLRVITQSTQQLTPAEASKFYAEHIGKPFHARLVEFMTSDACVIAVLEGEDAIASWRKLMGATNPEQREPGTIRADFGHPTIAMFNSVHGSDSPAAAAREISFMSDVAKVWLLGNTALGRGQKP